MSLTSIVLFLTGFIASHLSDCDKVRDFYTTHKTIECCLSDKLGQHDARNAMAIVAPEICLYSSLSDKAETYALKVLYAQTGKGNFSIGYFQMKPSFAEQIETSIINDKLLMKKYSELIIIEETAQATRAERITRLSSLKYQTLYLAAFYEIASNKVRGWMSNNKNQYQLLKNIATLYNGGLSISESMALQLQNKTQFPSMTTQKYNYSDLVVEFYQYLNTPN